MVASGWAVAYGRYSLNYVAHEDRHEAAAGTISPRSTGRLGRARHISQRREWLPCAASQARGHRDVVTAVGHSATIAAGEWITASGEWVNDRTHGPQFKAKFPVQGLDQRPGSPCHQSHPSRD